MERDVLFREIQVRKGFRKKKDKKTVSLWKLRRTMIPIIPKAIFETHRSKKMALGAVEKKSFRSQSERRKVELGNQGEVSCFPEMRHGRKSWLRRDSKHYQ